VKIKSVVHDGRRLDRLRCHRNTQKKGNGNGRKQRILRIAPLVGKLHLQRALNSWEQPRAA